MPVAVATNAMLRENCYLLAQVLEYVKYLLFLKTMWVQLVNHIFKVLEHCKWKIKLLTFWSFSKIIQLWRSDTIALQIMDINQFPSNKTSVFTKPLIQVAFLQMLIGS